MYNLLNINNKINNNHISIIIINYTYSVVDFSYYLTFSTHYKQICFTKQHYLNFDIVKFPYLKQKK